MSIDIKDYKPNSHAYKAKQDKKEVPAEKKVVKVVKGAAKTKKKSELKKFADNFISEDVSNIKSYVVTEVLIPTIKNTIWDALTNSLDMILYGETGHSKKRSSGGYVSYSSISSNRRDNRSESRVRTRFDYDDITFETRGDAEAVLEQMDDVIDRYGIVTVADMYDMADLTAPYTSNKYGWTSINSAEVVRVRDGYILKLPKARPID